MTAVKTLAGESLLIQIGDGATPTETFTHDCLINLDRAFELSADTNDILVPDCDDPTLGAWKKRTVDGLSGDISGSGKLHTASISTWFTWFNAASAKNLRVKTNAITGANGGGYWAGSFRLTKFGISGSRKDLCTVEVSIVSDGPLTWTANP